VKYKTTKRWKKKMNGFTIISVNTLESGFAEQEVGAMGFGID
jgi:hypothetical protein